MESIKNKPTLLLGTAMWGWTTEKKTAFALLDCFYEAGFRDVDCATNYPINLNPNDFRAAENILADWLRAHKITDMQVMMKVGSVNNMRSPEQILSKSFLLMATEQYQYLFQSNLKTMMIHWDNRDNPNEVNETINSLQLIHNQGFTIGLSGIKFPELYENIGVEPLIQIKQNILYSDYERYKYWHGAPRFIAYGINAGGLKLNRGEYSESSSYVLRGGNIDIEPPQLTALKARITAENLPIKNFNEAAILHALAQKDMYGILIGPSSVAQMEESIAIYKALRNRQ